MIFLTENIPYTPKMLADELDFEESTVQLALNALEQLGMIVNNGYIAIAGWDEHQNVEGMDRIREQNRIRQANFKAKKRLLQGNVTGNVTVTEGNATDIEKDKEEERDIEEDKKDICQQIVDLYHEICKSFPSVRSLSDARKKTIRSRLKTFSIDDFKQVFTSAENSSFLKGEDGGWKASFDWLIKEANFLKVLEGNYQDKPKRNGRKEAVPGWCTQPSLGEAELEAIQRIMKEPVTVGDDPDLAERAARLQKRLTE